MRTLSQEEIDQVGGGGPDQLKIGPITITGIEAGLALRNVMGAFGVAFAGGYALGTAANAGLTWALGDTVGNRMYQSGHAPAACAMTDDEVPPAFASIIGHVCGVIAVGMAALSAFFMWSLINRFSWQLLIFESILIGLTVLFFRWAGALTGYWNTRGRLAVPKVVYAFVGAIFVALGVFSLYVVTAKPMFLDEAPVFLFGLVGCGFLTYWSYLTYKRFK